MEDEWVDGGMMKDEWVDGGMVDEQTEEFCDLSAAYNFPAANVLNSHTLLSHKVGPALF